MDADYKHTELTKRIIGAAFEVHGDLGFGFAEKVYENALAVELRQSGMLVEQQAEIAVVYRGERVGDYRADLLVESKVIVEVKSVAKLMPTHEVQLVNYLKATGVEVGLLVNFGKSVKVRRKAMTREPSQ